MTANKTRNFQDENTWIKDVKLSKIICLEKLQFTNIFFTSFTVIGFYEPNVKMAVSDLN